MTRKIYCPVARKGGKCVTAMKTCRYCGVVSCDHVGCPVRYFHKPFNRCRLCGRKWAGQSVNAPGRILALNPFIRSNRREVMQDHAATQFRLAIEDASGFLSTCDGGDPGSVMAPSVWLLGIEPGWSFADQQADAAADPEATEQLETYAIERQLTWAFNRNAFKLLAAIEGHPARDYRDFAMRKQPFALGSKGYLKGNLFPVPFNSVAAWDEHASRTTGFGTKEEYKSWVRAARFPILKAWIERCRPRLVIGSGITHLDDFQEIVGAGEPPKEFQFAVNGHTKRVLINTSGTVPIAIIPHLSGGIHSLNSYESIERTAAIIRSEI